MPLTNQTLQQTISQIFFPKSKTKRVFLEGDVNTSQKQTMPDGGTVCYVAIESFRNSSLPYFDKGIYRKDGFATVRLKFVGVDSFKYAEQAQFLIYNTKARELFREIGADVMGVISTGIVPLIMSDTNMVSATNVRLKLSYTMKIDTRSSLLKGAELNGTIKVEEPSR